MGETDPLSQLVRAVRTSPKYRQVCEEFVRNVGSRELARRPNLKEAVKSTKNKLHQVGGAYLDQGMDYAGWLDDLRQATASAGRASLLPICQRIMQRHASTRERLPILDRFFSTALAGVAPVRTVLDLACGLNPLAIPWMPLAENAEYYGCDVYEDMVDFLNEFLALLGVKGRTWACDLTGRQTFPRVDVAFLLKTLPCLEQLDKSAGLHLLEDIQADHLLISYPVHSLGGRERGMLRNYEANFRSLLADRSWSIQRFEFPTELAFLVSR